MCIVYYYHDLFFKSTVKRYLNYIDINSGTCMQTLILVFFFKIEICVIESTENAVVQLCINFLGHKLHLFPPILTIQKLYFIRSMISEGYVF